MAHQGKERHSGGGFLQWAVIFRKPSDIGFDATGYDLPPLTIHEKGGETPKRDNGQLFNDALQYRQPNLPENP